MVADGVGGSSLVGFGSIRNEQHRSREVRFGFGDGLSPQCRQLQLGAMSGHPGNPLQLHQSILAIIYLSREVEDVREANIHALTRPIEYMPRGVAGRLIR